MVREEIQNPIFSHASMKQIAHDQLSSYKALNTPAMIDFTVGYSILNNSAQSKHETIQYKSKSYLLIQVQHR